MRPTCLLLSLALVSTGGVARAEDQPADPCAAATTQADLNACTARGAQQADAELDAAMKALLAANKSDAVAVAKLKAAQRAWVAFRDAELDSRFALGPNENPRVKFGSVYPMCFSQVKEALTRRRVAELKARATRAEGEVCP